MTMTTADPGDGRHLQSPRDTLWALAITSVAALKRAGRFLATRLHGEKDEA
jgi:hypothetical protein